MAMVCSFIKEVHSTRTECVVIDNSNLGAMNFSTPVDWPPSVESTADSSNLSSIMSVGYSPQMIGDDSGDGLQASQNYSPKLAIVEQPQEKFRFRYKSEMMGTHGCILGRKSDRLLKSYPQVKLINYTGGSAVIRCSLVAYIGNRKDPVPHAHRLIVRVHDVDREEPQEMFVDEHSSYTAVFQGMGIVHTAKKYVVEELVKKKKRSLLDEIKGRRDNDTSLTIREELQIREEAQAEAKMMNLNIVHLCFEALFKDSFGVLRPICEKVYSTPISNMKSAQTGELKICRIDKHVSSCLGGEEVFILVEKVGKKNIQVRFFELDEEDNEIWEDFGKFTELDVHHQYAVVFRTPRYRDINIEQPVDVFLQLFRPSDKDTSEPIRFTFKPREMVGRKRLRSQISYDTIPTAVVQGFLHQNETVSGLDILGLQCNNLVESQPARIDKLQLSTTIASTIAGNSSFPSVNPNTPDGWADISIEDLIRENNIPDNYIKNLSSFGYFDGLENDLAVDCARIPPRKGCSDTVDSDLVMDCVNTSPRKEGLGYSSKNSNGKIGELAAGVDKIKSDQTLHGKKHLKSHPFSVNIIKQMCDLGSNTDSLRRFLERSTIDGNMTLHLVVTYCQYVLLKKLLILIKKRKLFRYIDETNDLHQTPLHLAVLIKDWEKVRLLLQAGAKPENKDIKGNTAYHLAVNSQYHNDHSDKSKLNVEYSFLNPCLKELLDLKNYPKSSFQVSNLNLTNEAGMTPLHLAVENGDIMAVEALLDTKCDVNCFDDHGGCSALHMAIVAGNVQIIQLLLSQPSINVECCNRRGINALKLASIINRENFQLSKMLKEKMNIDEETKEVTLLLESKEDYESSDGEDSERQLEDDRSLQEEAGSEKECGDQEEDFVDSEVNAEDSSYVMEEETLACISNILDESGKWKDLARFLKFDFLVLAIQEQTSPSRALLSYVDVNGGVSVESLKEIMEMLGEKAAATEVEKMILRQK